MSPGTQSREGRKLVELVEWVGGCSALAHTWPSAVHRALLYTGRQSALWGTHQYAQEQGYYLCCGKMPVIANSRLRLASLD